MLIWEGNQFYETLYQFVFTRLLSATVVFEIKGEEYITITIGVSRKLGDERCEQIAALLLVGVPKVEVKIGHRSHSAVVQGNYVSNNCGANLEVRRSNFPFSNNGPDYTFAGARYERYPSVAARWKREKEHTFSVNPQKRTRGLPFLENATLKEPPRCPLVVNVTGHVIVGG